MREGTSPPRSPYWGLEQVARGTPVKDGWVCLLPDDARFCVYREIPNLEEWTDSTIATATSKPSQAAVDVHRMLLTITLSGKSIPYCVTAALRTVLDIENHFKRVVTTEKIVTHYAAADVALPEPFQDLIDRVATVDDDTLANLIGVSARTIYNRRSAPWFGQEVAGWRLANDIDQTASDNGGSEDQGIRLEEWLARRLIGTVRELEGAQPGEGMRACAYLLGSMSWVEERVLPFASLNAIATILRLVDPISGTLDLARLWNTRLPDRYRQAAMADGRSLAKHGRRLTERELQDEFGDHPDAPEVNRSIRNWRKGDAYRLIEADAQVTLGSS